LIASDQQDEGDYDVVDKIPTKKGRDDKDQDLLKVFWYLFVMEPYRFMVRVFGVDGLRRFGVAALAAVIVGLAFRLTGQGTVESDLLQQLARVEQELSAAQAQLQIQISEQYRVIEHATLRISFLQEQARGTVVHPWNYTDQVGESNKTLFFGELEARVDTRVQNVSHAAEHIITDIQTISELIKANLYQHTLVDRSSKPIERIKVRMDDISRAMESIQSILKDLPVSLDNQVQQWKKETAFCAQRSLTYFGLLMLHIPVIIAGWYHLWTQMPKAKTM